MLVKLFSVSLFTVEISSPVCLAERVCREPDMRVVRMGRVCRECWACSLDVGWHVRMVGMPSL